MAALAAIHPARLTASDAPKLIYCLMAELMNPQITITAKLSAYSLILMLIGSTLLTVAACNSVTSTMPVTMANAAPIMPREGLVARTKIRPVLTSAPIKLFIIAAPAKLSACRTA